MNGLKMLCANLVPLDLIWLLLSGFPLSSECLPMTASSSSPLGSSTDMQLLLLQDWGMGFDCLGLLR